MFDPSVIFTPQVVWVLIPITAIGLSMVTGMVKMFLDSAEKRLKIKMQMQQGKDSGVKEQIEALRAEIASLRDTSTQFDMSLQHNLEGLAARMQEIEKGRRGHPTTSSVPEQEEQVQRIGRG